MALTSTDFMAGVGLFGASTNVKIDCSDILAATLLKDTATLGQIPMKGTVHNIEHFWMEDELAACILSGQISISTDHLSGALYLGHPSTTAKVQAAIRYGGILKQEYGQTTTNAAGGVMGGVNHIFRCSTSNDMTLSVAIYSTLGVAGSVFLTTATSSSTRWFVVGNPKADESDYSEDISQARTRRKNYTQIFERGIRIAQTRQGMEQWAVSDELKLQIKYRTFEIKRELNNAVLNGHAYTSGTAITPYIGTHTMAGIVQLIRDPNLDGTVDDTTATNASAAALTLTKINDLCKKMYDVGGFPEGSNCVIITSPYQARVIALLEEGRIRKSSNELIVGSYANAVKTDLGFDLPVIIDRFCAADQLIILDKAAAAIMPLAGDSWGLVKMAKTGRTDGYQLSGQYTLELRNPNSRHGMLYHLAYS